MEIELRDYQVEGWNALRESARQYRRTILCAPTGSGKTMLAAHLMKEAQKKGTCSLFVVDRLVLVDQTSDVFDSYHIDHGIIQGGHWRDRKYERVQICSAQTLARRGWPEGVKLVVVDEAHTIQKTTVDYITQNDVTVVGLTATPFSRGLGKIYQNLVNVTTTAQLIDEGFLAPYRIFACAQPDMEGVKVVAGEWEEHETSQRAMKVVGDCVVEYQRHGGGTKFIAAAVDVAHCEELNRQFSLAGIQTATYTYRDSDELRKELVHEFRKRDSYIRGLITVSAATKGFDVPDLGCIIMARPLRKSLSEFIQLFGRGLRPYPGKKECVVLDHSGNCARFWDAWNLFFQQGAVALDDGKQRAKSKPPSADDQHMMECPSCHQLHDPMPCCPGCGHEYPKRLVVKHMAGDLVELVASGNRPLMTAHVWPQVVAYARSRKPDDSVGASKLALALYKQMTGTWPTRKFDETASGELTPEVFGKIQQLRIAYQQSLKKRVAA